MDTHAGGSALWMACFRRGPLICPQPLERLGRRPTNQDAQSRSLHAYVLNGLAKALELEAGHFRLVRTDSNLPVSDDLVFFLHSDSFCVMFALSRTLTTFDFATFPTRSTLGTARVYKRPRILLNTIVEFSHLRFLFTFVCDFHFGRGVVTHSTTAF
jgi:hypothetical protein